MDTNHEVCAAREAALMEALEGAMEWLDELGCDCGEDEPGTCAHCVGTAVLADPSAAARDLLERLEKAEARK